MAHQPHRDDDQAKKPDEAGKSPVTPKPGANPPTPRPVIPHMELDDVVEGELIPTVEAAPDSAVIARPVEEAPEVMPIEGEIEEVEVVEEVTDSDVFLGEVVEEAPTTHAETPEPKEAHPLSDVIAVNEADLVDEPTEEVTALPSEPSVTSSVAVPAPAPSDVHLADLAEEVVSEAVESDHPTAATPPAPVAVEEPTVSADLLASDRSPATDVAAPFDAVSDAPGEPRPSAPATDVAPAEPIVSETPTTDVAPSQPAESLQEEIPVESPIWHEATESIAPSSDVLVDEPVEIASSPSDVVVSQEVEEPVPAEVTGADLPVLESPSTEAIEAIEAAEPGSEVVAAEEFVEEAAPVSDVVVSEEIIEEAAPVSDVAPSSGMVLSDEDLEQAAADALAAPSEPRAEAAPVSDVVVVDEAVEEVMPASALDEAAPASEVVAADEVVDEAVPTSEVLVSEEVVEEAAPSSDLAQVAQGTEGEPSSGVVLTSDDLQQADVGSPASPATPTSALEPVSKDAPAPEVMAAEDDLEKAAAVALAAPVSDVVVADEVVEEIAPSSGIAVGDEAIAEDVAPVSDVLVSEEVVEAAPASEVLAAEEAVEDAAPVSDVLIGEDVIEDARPASEVLAAEEVADAAPASEVFAAEEVIEEIGEAVPASAVVEAEEVLDDLELVEEIEEAPKPAAAKKDPGAYDVLDDLVVEEAAPASEIVQAEEVFDDLELVEEAAPVSEVAAAEEVIDEMTDAVEVGSAELVAEAAEVVEESSSATRKSESVLLEDIGDATVAEGLARSRPSAPEDLNQTEFVDVPAAKGPASEVLAGEATTVGSSSVLFEDLGEPASAVQPAPDLGKTTAEDAGKTVVFDQATVPFEGKPPSSATKKGPPSSLVTEEELVASSEASAVDLGEMPPRKGSTTGIDKVAEQLESGIDEPDALAETTPPEPSVMFDDLVDEDVAEAVEEIEEAEDLEVLEAVEEVEEAPAPKAKKKPGETSTELDSLAIEEFEEAVEDVEDAEPLEGEAEEVAEAEDFEEVEAAEALDADETGAPEALEAEALEADEVEEAEALEALDEDAAPPPAKKKGKTAAHATGDDVDLDALFADDDKSAKDVDAEAAEVFDEELEAAAAEEAEEAEAVVFDDEEEAPSKSTKIGKKTVMSKKALEELDDLDAEAVEEEEDEKPVKKTKMAKRTAVTRDEDEDEEAEAFDDEEDERPKKKGKKDKKPTKERATVAAPQGPGFVLRWAGRFFLMFFGMILLAGAAVGAFFLAEDEHKKLAAGYIYEPPPPKKAGPERKKIDELREMIAKGDYKKAADQLASTKEKEELNLRGEARWLSYFQAKAQAKEPLDKDAKEVAEAIADLKAADNNALIQQIQATVMAKDVLDQLDAERKKLAKLTTERDTLDKAQNAIADVFVKRNYIKDKTELDPVALGKLMDALNDDRVTLAEVNKILKDNEIKGTGKEGLDELVKLKNGLDLALTEVNKVLDNEKTKDKGAKGVMEIVDERNMTKKDRDDVLKTLADAFKELIDGKIVDDPKADPRKSIVEGVKIARQKAESPLSIPLSQLGLSLGNIGTGTSKAVEKTFDMSKIFTELGFFQTREPFIQSPQQKMTTYVALLQDRKENDAKRMAAISREADWVLSPESKSDDEAKAKARYVQGLALRNQEKYAEAKTAFEEAVKMIPGNPKPGEWTKLANQSLRELTDPFAYYVPRMQRFQADGDLKAALDEANTALKAIPDDARLNVYRGLIRLELVRGQGAKIPGDEQKAIREDADVASKDGKLSAESSYLIGLLEDEMGNMDEAEKLYKKAIKLHEDMKGPPDNAGKYRVALGKLLLRDRTEAPEPKNEEKKIEEKKKDEEKKIDDKKIDEEKKKDLSAATLEIIDPSLLLIVCCVTHQQQGQPDEVEDKETLARYKAVLEQANQLIGSADPVLKGQGHLLLGQVYSKMGRRTEGLKEYAKGLSLLTTKTKLKGKEIDDLIDLIENHPAFSQPDISGVPNPAMAERHFGEGIHLYWSGKYPQAEAQFRQAVKYYSTDARYQYYLGLSQLAQRTPKKRDAGIYALEQGARLEAKAAETNPFAVREINASLERVQGELRQFLNGIRYRVQMGELDEKLKAL